MKFYKIIMISILAGLCLMSCSDEDPVVEPPVMMTDAPVVNFNSTQSVDIATTVNLDASASTGEGVLSYAWSVTDPAGGVVSLSSATAVSTSFEADMEGSYMIVLAVTNDGGTTTGEGTVMSINPTFVRADQMGRPAINTVFNFFGDAEAKNGFNMTTPEGGNADPVSFKGILDALQTYIGLDASAYANVLGLDNETTATVLATDVLMSNKNFPSTYGPSDLSDLRLGENLLNGRGLNDDVVDVTLILAFGGDLTGLSDLQAGLIGDNVPGNDKMNSDEFPYLGAPH